MYKSASNQTCCGRQSRNQMPELGSLGDSTPKRLCQTCLFSLACRSYLTSSTFRHICPWSCLHRQVASSEVRSVFQAIECFGHAFYTFCRPKDSNSGIHLSLRRPHQVRFAIDRSASELPEMTQFGPNGHKTDMLRSSEPQSDAGIGFFGRFHP